MKDSTWQAIGISGDSKFSGPEGMEFRLLHNSMVVSENE